MAFRRSLAGGGELPRSKFLFEAVNLPQARPPWGRRHVGKEEAAGGRRAARRRPELLLIGGTRSDEQAGIR
jgi:hypothetical protein